MPRTLHVLLLLVLLTVPLRSRTALDEAQQARALLGPAVWSQIIRIENDARGSPYPKVVHALVFELAGMLWFYADVNGTQSFSLHRNRLAWEKKNFGPLLHDIEPGFKHWTPVDAPAVREPDAGIPLRNGCFIESFTLLRQRLEHGLPARNPRLLSYYAKTVTGVVGHTVLAYEAAGAIEIVNPLHPLKPGLYPRALGSDPLALARAIEGPRIINARMLPLEPPPGPPAPQPPTLAGSMQNSRNFPG